MKSWHISERGEIRGEGQMIEGRLTYVYMNTLQTRDGTNISCLR